jgi:hypothetical protein
MRHLFFTFFCLSAVIISCSENDTSSFSPSDEFIDSNVNFQVIDTISFTMSTFKIDSLTTDLDSNILVGRYEDPAFGKVVCNGFVNFLPSVYNLEDEMVFDSIVLNLKYSGYYYNDTLKQKKIKILKLDKKLDYLNGQQNFYNTSDFPASTLIGQKTFYPRIAKDSIKATLDYGFGLNIFNKIRDGVITNNEELGQYFKGLKISPDDSEDASIISFDVNKSYLRFYYSDPDETDQVLYYDFKYSDFNTNKNHFTQIRCDRTSTILPVNFINQENEFKSQNTNNLTFIQAGEGIVTKIAFPNFKESMANLNTEGTIYKANLKIPLKNTSYSKKLFTSDSLRVFIIDQNNNIVSETKNAKIKLEDSEFNKKYINVFIEPYLNKVLQNNYYKKYGLMLLPYDYSTSTTRLILNDNHNDAEKTKLILTYLTYDK